MPQNLPLIKIRQNKLGAERRGWREPKLIRPYTVCGNAMIPKNAAKTDFQEYAVCSLVCIFRDGNMVQDAT